MIFPDEKNKKISAQAFAACEAGDFEALERLIAYHYNLEDCDEEGNSGLHYAVRGGDMRIIRYLTEQGGLDPTWANLHMITPMHLARELCPEAYAYFTQHVGFSLEEAYQNPVRRGMHPDPSILRVGDDYYMVNSSFVMFPGIPVSHSRDLVHWKVIGYAVTDAAWAKEHLGHIQGGRGFWAPDISYHDGRFYICATLRQNDDAAYIQTQMVTSAECPEGPYETPVIHNLLGIDPSIFTDDGRRYMLINRGARIVEISPDGKALLGEPRLIWYGSSKHAPEGPHILKKDGWYYCFLAEGGTGMGHMITVARSRNLYGPYEDCPYNPIMRQKHSAAIIQCAGHGKPVSTPDGRWFMVYLCSRFLEGKWGMLGRETCLDEITWTADGWPLVNMGRGPGNLRPLPYGASAEPEKTPAGPGAGDNSQLREEALGQRADAASNVRKKALGQTEWRCGTDAEESGWLSPRTMDPAYLRRIPGYAWSKENGRLIFGADGGDQEQTSISEEKIIEIKGCGRDLCEVDCLSLLVKNQPDFDFDCCFELLDAVQEGVDTGVTLYYDENTYVKFGRTATEVFVAEYYDGCYVREVKRPVSELNMPAIGQESAGSERTGEYFRIETRGLERSFYYNDVKLETWRVTGICSEGLQKGKRFTSAMYGVYVNGEDILRWRQHGNL